MSDLSAYLDAVQGRADAATPGPWDPRWTRWYPLDGAPVEDESDWAYRSDGEFIAAARTDVPAMIAALRAVVALCDGARDQVGAPWGGGGGAVVSVHKIRAALSSLTPDTPRSET